jgi:hypothetical protein
VKIVKRHEAKRPQGFSFLDVSKSDHPKRPDGNDEKGFITFINPQKWKYRICFVRETNGEEKEK